MSFHTDVRGRDAASLLDAWPTLSGVASAVSRAGVDIVVLQAAVRGEAVMRDGVVYEFVRDRRALIARAAALAPDVVHVHGFIEARAVRRLCRAMKSTPVLVQDHGVVPPSFWRGVAWAWLYRGVTAAAFTARDQAQPLIDARILRRDVSVFEVVEGSTSFTPGDRAEARAVTGLAGMPCLLWTGRLNDNKDPLMMLDAVERAASALPAVRLWCCFTEAPLREAVERRIAASTALSRCTTLLGARRPAEMERLFRAADLYLQASHREAGGYSLIEALACGTPPIATDIPPARRIIGDAGALVPVGDAEGMARAIVDWAARDGTQTRAAARERFESALTFDAIGESLRDAYATLARRS